MGHRAGALFEHNLFVEWEGLMDFAQPGNYTVGFTYTDGVRLWLDGSGW